MKEKKERTRRSSGALYSVFMKVIFSITHAMFL